MDGCQIIEKNTAIHWFFNVAVFSLGDSEFEILQYPYAHYVSLFRIDISSIFVAYIDTLERISV